MIKSETILDEIVDAKRQSVNAKKKSKSFKQLEDECNMMKKSKSTFYDILKKSEPKVKIIAEIKYASPSEGTFSHVPTIDIINKNYQNNTNICAISILTEVNYFNGEDNYLKFVKKHNTEHKPILRKDFIFDPYQILESKILGADAYLIIASLFDETELRNLVDYGLSIGIEPLLEIHTEEELNKALKTRTRCIGANSRNLQSFKLDNRVHELLKPLNNTYVRVAESGIESPEYLNKVIEFVDAVLIGGYFMKSNNFDKSMQYLIPKNKMDLEK